MNPNYDAILSADQNTCAGLFTTTAQRLGTTPQNAEKDFWVCWTLDLLFHGIPEGPRVLFKGGTSRSKGLKGRGGSHAMIKLLIALTLLRSAGLVGHADGR